MDLNYTLILVGWLYSNFGYRSKLICSFWLVLYSQRIIFRDRSQNITGFLGYTPIISFKSLYISTVSPVGDCFFKTQIVVTVWTYQIPLYPTLDIWGSGISAMAFCNGHSSHVSTCLDLAVVDFVVSSTSELFGQQLFSAKGSWDIETLRHGDGPWFSLKSEVFSDLNLSMLRTRYNCRFYRTYMDEDMIGTCKGLAKRARRKLLERRLLCRFLLGCEPTSRKEW